MDLLTPNGLDLRENYVHQLQQTINAYSPTHRFIGEALQNALDAVRDAGGGRHEISINFDFESHEVRIRDDGPGFPNDPRLLFLGGGRKIGRGFAGLVGVGLKVLLFSTEHFQLRAKSDSGSLKFAIQDAHLFSHGSAEIALDIDEEGHFREDPDPLSSGTELVYRFPKLDNGKSVQLQYLRDVRADCLKRDSLESAFGETLRNACDQGGFPNRLAALIGVHLLRYTYLGLTVVPDELSDTTVSITMTGLDAEGNLGELGPLADGQLSCSFELAPHYFSVDEAVGWIPRSKRRPVLTDRELANGGRGLVRTDLGFNRTSYSSPDEYELLLTNARGEISGDVETYRRRLWPRINSIALTVGRIKEFENYLPGGAAHTFSANGVVTKHDVEFNRGQNQQYVRCFDINVDVKAELNYGKNAFTDMHLVKLLRKFLNDAYATTIQFAAANFVGKLRSISEPTEDAFLTRPDLVSGLTQKKIPRDENDVIALTFELAGMGYFPDYRWYGLSSKDTYDARAVIRRSSDLESILTEAPHEGSLRVVEFKLRAGSIARDFNREEKDPRRLDLIIAYELGESALPDQYQILSLDDSTVGKNQNRVFPGVSHVIYDALSGVEVQVLLLRPMIANIFAPPEPGILPDEVQDE
ncbi:ATP-binding protein [Streptomyces sp. NPDC001604]|uniref:ATP-binding protein n=1 Tax=Streptomyces sp. NPDC001604 TaxID=3364593 RepID=UPI00367806B3